MNIQNRLASYFHANVNLMSGIQNGNICDFFKKTTWLCKVLFYSGIVIMWSFACETRKGRDKNQEKQH